MKEAHSRRSANESSQWVQVSKAWTVAAVPLVAVLAVGFLGGEFPGAVSSGAMPSGAMPSGAMPSGATAPLGAEVIHATPLSQSDSDLDGIPDAQEQVIGTSPFYADSDGDGFSDAEEFARNSHPMDSSSVPLPAGSGISMSARGENGELRILIAAYVGDGKADARGIDVGVLIARRQFWLDPGRYAFDTSTRRIPAAGGGEVVILDLPLDPNAVGLVGELSVFTTLTSSEQSTVLAAASIDLMEREGVIVLVQDAPGVGNSAMAVSANSGAGAVYNPIPPGGGGDIPSSWVPGEICYQSTVVVGVANGVITREVVAADCLEGWDASCRADCASSVGDSFDSFDPIGLVGG